MRSLCEFAVVVFAIKCLPPINGNHILPWQPSPIIIPIIITIITITIIIIIIVRRALQEVHNLGEGVYEQARRQFLSYSHCSN